MRNHIVRAGKSGRRLLSSLTARKSAKRPAAQPAVESLESGFFCLGERQRYAWVVQLLRDADPYMVCADFDSYLASMREAAQLYRTPREWARRSLFNIVGASAFSEEVLVRLLALGRKQCDLLGTFPQLAARASVKHNEELLSTIPTHKII